MTPPTPTTFIQLTLIAVVLFGVSILLTLNRNLRTIYRLAKEIRIHMSATSDNLTALQTAVAELTGKVDAVAEDVPQVKSKLDELLAKIEALQNQTGEVTAQQLADLATDVKAASAKLTDINTALDADSGVSDTPKP